MATFPGRVWASASRPVEAARPVDAKNAPTRSLEKPHKTRLFHSHHRPSSGSAETTRPFTGLSPI